MKICGLTRPEDVDAAVGAGADAIGFVLYPPSPRYVTPQRAAELAARLPAFVTPVLLFVNAPAAEVIAAATLVPGALLQFHGDETPEDCWAAAQGRSAFLRAARIPLDPDGPPFDLIGFSKRFDRARAILLDAHVPGYGGGGAYGASGCGIVCCSMKAVGCCCGGMGCWSGCGCIGCIGCCCATGVPHDPQNRA